jgi:hypothetical protein
MEYEQIAEKPLGQEIFTSLVGLLLLFDMFPACHVTLVVGCSGFRIISSRCPRVGGRISPHTGICIARFLIRTRL